jgi:undecaprenyl-diphosphatase
VKPWAWIAVLGIAFFALALLVHTGQTAGFDRHFLLSLRTGDNHDPIGPWWIEWLFHALTRLGNWYVVLGVAGAVIAWLIYQAKQATAFLVAVTTGGQSLVNEILKWIFDRARPDLVAHGVETSSTSFPSGHAMAAAAVYLTLAALLVRTQKSRAAKIAIISAAVLIAVLIGISRIYLGVHWPTDVIGGWLAGAAWALICWEIARKLQKRGKIERAES